MGTMKTRFARISDKRLHRIVKESVDKVVNEAENGGWIVDSNEVQDAYDMAVKHMGKETIDAAVVRCLGDEQLAQCLAYVFRMYDFREWSNR